MGSRLRALLGRLRPSLAALLIIALAPAARAQTAIPPEGTPPPRSPRRVVEQTTTTGDSLRTTRTVITEGSNRMEVVQTQPLAGAGHPAGHPAGQPAGQPTAGGGQVTVRQSGQHNRVQVVQHSAAPRPAPDTKKEN
jgi:hypothetical protein